VAELSRAMERQGLDMKVTALVSKLICRLSIIPSMRMLCIYVHTIEFDTHSNYGLRFLLCAF
jgi:hypothetical protein